MSWRSRRNRAARRVFRALALAGVILLAAAGRPQAAVAEFFWAGFNVADPHVDAAKIGQILYKSVDGQFRNRSRGAIPALLEGLEWDEFAYYETAAETGYVKENMRDVYGVFLSIDRVMSFKPSVVRIAGRGVKKYYTYIFATLNVFAADSRNLVYSHPVFLVDVSGRPNDVAQTLKVTLGKLAGQLKDAQDPYTAKIMKDLQAYYGPPGVSLEAIRRTPNAIQPIDDFFANTFGVMKLCGECVGVLDKSGMTEPDPATMGDFARFFLNARLAEYRQVTFLPEQSRTVEERTGDVAATAKQGDIRRDFSEVCLPEYDETGKSQVCVKVPPPRNPMWISVRSLVKASKGASAVVTLSFVAAVDIQAEMAGHAKPLEKRLAETGYTVPAADGEEVSNVYYINALMKAIDKLDEKTIR